MNRRIEARVSREKISKLKTIYVEGKLDYLVVNTVLTHNSFNHINVIQINNEIDDSHLPIEEREISKKKVINLIDKLNEETHESHKYIGIVDLDLDFVNDSCLDLNNLLYTDFSMMESYFLDIELINRFLEEYNKNNETLEHELFNQYLENLIELSQFFLYQFKVIQKLSKEEIIEQKDKFIKFKDLSFCSNFTIDKKTRFILLDKILHKEIAAHAQEIKENFIAFCDTSTINMECKLKFIHGKYTFQYIICNLKEKYSDIQKLHKNSIECILKDKFILHNYYLKYNLFNSVLTFARA